MNRPILNEASAISKIVVGVDDAAENLLLLQAAVKAGGYTFMGARSGTECLSLVGKMAPRLILLDIEMPDPDGFETCRRLRLIRQLSRVPIAFLTARKTPEDVKRGIALGGNDFIVKPFDPVKLLDRIRHWTGRTVG
jgi:two-component system OmpR family response regulator